MIKERDKRQMGKKIHTNRHILVMLLELPVIAVCALNQLIQYGPVSVNTE